MSTPSSSNGSGLAHKSHGAPPLARPATRLVALTAVVLIVVSAGSYLHHRRQLDSIAAEHLRLIVTGPAALHAGAAAAYSVTTTDVTGVAMPTLVELALYSPEGKRLQEDLEETDENGCLQMTVPADMALPAQVQLKITAMHGQKREAIATSLPVEGPRYLTCLSLDRAWYRPGETAHYRAISLAQFGLAPDRAGPRWFDVRDPRGTPLPHARQEVAAEHGVAAGSFEIPAGAAPGRYRLAFGSVGTAAPEEERSLLIRRARRADVAPQLEFLRDRYGAGDTVVALYGCGPANAGGETRAVQVLAKLDGQTVLQNSAETDASGRLRIEFKLPKTIDDGHGQLAVAWDEHGTPQRVSRPIPIALGRLDVQFYPEGGELAAGLENRVYFTARTSQGQAVSIGGAVVDERGTSLAAVETVRDGRGSFRFTPQAGEAYRLKIVSPAEFAQQIALPAASAERKVTLSAAAGIFKADSPLEFNIRAAKAGLPLVAAVWCRGVLVGQQALVSASRNNGSNPVSIPLDEQVGGVLRLTVYDYSSSPPKALAERLVYRHAARRLAVGVKVSTPQAAGSEKPSAALRVTDEKGKPAAAVLGVSLVDGTDAVAAAPGLASFFWLASQLPRPYDVEKADFYLSDDPDAPAALDLLLATQATHPTLDAQRSAEHAAKRARAERLPVMFDNLNDLRTRYEDTLATYRAERTRALNALITLSFFGGLALLLSVALLGLMKIVWGLQLLLPTLAATACCVVVAAVLLDPSRQQSGESATVAFTPSSPMEKQGPAATTDSPRPQASATTEAATAAQEEADADTPDEPEAAEGQPPRAVGHAATAYWNPLLIADAQGRASVPWAGGEAASRWHLSVDAHGDGRIGSAQRELPGLPSADAAARADRPSTPPGILQQVAYSGQIDGSQRVAIDVPRHCIPGSLAVTLYAFPSVLADLEQALDATGSEPLGGTEAVLSRNDLAALTLGCLADHGRADPSLVRQAKQRWGSGLDRLWDFPSPESGPILPLDLSDIDVLTAYAWLVFHEPAAPRPLDAPLAQVAAQWGPARRDMKGPPVPEPNADGRTVAIRNAYIAWALIESRQKPPESQMRDVLETAAASSDPYLVALAATAALANGHEEQGAGLLQKLAASQARDGHLDAARTSISGSRGRSLRMETTALAALAWLKGSGFSGAAERAIEWILTQRDAQGSFGSTQATVLAVKALVAHAAGGRRPCGEGKLAVKRDGHVIAERKFSAGEEQVLVLRGLQEKLVPGSNPLVLSLSGNNKMPYMVRVAYRTLHPQNDADCPVRLSTQFDRRQVKVGGSVILTARLQNTTAEPLPMTVAVVGLPPGLELRAASLERRQRHGTPDYYERRAGEVIFYWRSLTAKQKVELPLEFTAVVAGKQQGPASRAYLYDTPECVQWAEPLLVEVGN